MNDDAWLGAVGPDRLDAFVARVDAGGGPGGPAFDALCRIFRYVPVQQVDQDLDPLSEAYGAQMIALYHEIAGRDLDQSTGEMTDFEIERHVVEANPYALRDANFISRHARTVLTTVMVANLPGAPRILDLGCGWGLSTEMLGFTGAEVTAVDINPRFVELVSRRAARRGAKVEVVQSNFDDLALDGLYDFALFYECLHHAVKPWETIAHVARFMKPDGRIAIAGEPIDEYWWRSWGLRLDPLSLYCIRKFGWFESGWSADFIARVFAENGWTLTLIPGIGLDDGPIGVAQRADIAVGRPLALPAARFFEPPQQTAAPAPVAQARRRSLLRRLF